MDARDEPGSREVGPKRRDAPPASPIAHSITPVRLALGRLRARAKARLLLQRAALIIAGAAAVALGLALLDYALRLPAPVRVAFWVSGLILIVAAVRRLIIPAARFTPSLTEMALRLERSEAGRVAGLGGVLASGLELSATGDAGSRDAMGALTVGDAAARFAPLARAAGVLDHRRLGRAAGAVLAATLPIVALALTVPALARIGAARTLAPWAGTSWPKRTGIADAGAPAAHAIGAALPLRAVLTRSDRAPGRAEVAVRYRIVTDEEAGPWRSARLTPQNHTQSVETRDGVLEGQVYERLLETTGLASDGAELEYAFQTRDDETSPARVRLVTPPAVVGARVEIIPPAYALPLLTAGLDVAHGPLDVGPGRDARAAIGPVLAGSRVTLALDLSKPVAGPGPEGPAAWAATRVPGLEDALGLTVHATASTWTIRFDAKGSLRVPVMLIDEHGIASVEEVAYRFDVVDDHAPAAAVIEPAQDESVLPSAAMEVAGEGRDDIGLAWVALRMQLAKPPAGSAGAAPEPAGDAVDLARAESAPPTVGTSDAGGAQPIRAGGSLDLASLGLAPGDEVWLTAEAVDVYEMNGVRHDVATSSRRRLRVIAESDLVEQVRAELTGLREAAKRLEQEQGRLADATEESAVQEALAGEPAQDAAAKQAAVGERLTPMGDALARLAARVARNRLDDEALAGVLRDAEGLADAAQEASDRAEEALDRLAAPAVVDPAVDAAKAVAEARVAQESLTQIAALLDQGQDSWAVKRELERLLTEQRQITAQTAAAGAQTQGRDAASLGRQEREDLERLAKRQQEAAQRAAAAIEQLQQRADQLAQTDPAQARAMQNAASAARQAQLDAAQRQAAEQIRQNQTGAAQKQQQKAEAALEEALDRLDEAQQQRDDRLRRALADLIASLQGLIDAQQAQLAALGAAVGAGGEPAALDRPMIALHQNTLGVQATVQSTMADKDRLLALVAAAADAQAAAVASLRGSPAGLAEADRNERVSLARLTEARDEAQRLEDQAEERDEDRTRERLLKTYREALESQVSIQAETTPLLARDLSRRERTTARGLGARQDELRARLDRVRSDTQDLADARLFGYAHTRLDATTAAAAGQLRQGLTPPAVGRDQASAVRVLQGLVEALRQEAKRRDEFREAQAGGEEGGGGEGQGGPQPLIPPIAELKLLRFMQQEAAERTRLLGENDASAADGELEALGALQGDLAEHAAELLRKLMEQGKNGPPLRDEKNADPRDEAGRDPAPKEPAE